MLLKIYRPLFPNVHEEELWNAVKEVVDGGVPSLKGISLARKFSEAQDEFVRNNFGVFSLTADPSNVIMWSHYADSHKGLCICFDVLKLMKFLTSKRSSTGAVFELHKIKYAREYPIIQPSGTRNGEALLQVLITKSVDWKYENEFRIILYEATKAQITIPHKIITCIIMGCQISTESRQEIIETLRQKKSSAKLCQARMKDSDFDLNLEEVTY